MKKFLIVNLFSFSLFFLQAQQPALVLPIGHTASFGSLFFSPDGNVAASTAFKDKMVAVWDVKTGKLLATFSDTLAFWGFRRLFFSQDGKKLFTAGGSNMIWDVEKKKLLLDLDIRQEDDEASSAAHYVFSPEGKKLACAKDSQVTIITVADEKITGRVKTPGFKITSLLYSPDGKYLAINAKEKTFIWNANDSIALFRLGEGGKVFFSPDSKKIVTWNLGQLTVYDIETRSIIREISCSPPESGYFSPDSKKIIVIIKGLKGDNEYRKAILFDIGKGVLLNQWDSVSAARFHPDNETVVVIKEGPEKKRKYDDYLPTSKVEIWNSITNKLIKKWDAGFSLIINQDGNRIAGVTDKVVRIFNSKTGTVLREWNWHGHIPSYNTTISPDGKRVLTSSSHINIWDSESGTMLSSGFIGNDENEFESTVNIVYAPDSSTFVATKKGNWQIWNSRDARLLLRSSNNFKGNTRAAISYNSQQAAITHQNEKQSYLEVYDLKQLKRVKKFPLGISPVKAISFSPDNTKLIISYEEKNNTEIRMAGTLALVKTIPGIIGGGFSRDGTKMITTTGKKEVTASYDNNVSYIWNIKDGSLFGKQAGIAKFSPVDNKIVTNVGLVWNLKHKDSIEYLEKIDEYFLEHSSVLPHFSPDGRKVIGIAVSEGSAGQFPSVYVWDVKTGKLIQSLDTAFAYNDFVSRSGKKLVHVPVNEDEDMKIIDVEKRDTVWLFKSNDASRARYAEFSSDDKYLFTSNDQTIKKWEVATGRLLFTFFPVDSTAYLTRIPSGYYSCSQDAARSLHYVKGMQVISFAQLDIRYNRPDKVLEHINYPDTILTNAYRKAWLKRIKKLDIDTIYFQAGYSVPEAAFVNRDKIDDEQKEEKLTLHILGSDSVYHLSRFNIWINEVPLFGLRGINVRQRGINQFDTTVTIMLSQGENRIETSVTNINGMESYRSPLLVKYMPSKNTAKTEQLHFVGIGINNFTSAEYNLNWSVKDIRDLSVNFKKKYGNNCRIDTLFNEQVTTGNIKALKNSLLKTGINDKVIIAYSGHGMLSKEYDYYLSTYSVNFEKPEQNGLPYDELENLLDGIPARKKLMLIDACHSGEVDKEDLVRLNASPDSLIKGLKPVGYKQEGHLGLKNSFELMQSLFVNVGKSTGATIISAAAGTQFALERNDLKNGVFTFSILEAMNTYPGLKISELKKIVGERVEQLTKGLQKPTSRNETISVDWSIW